MEKILTREEIDALLAAIFDGQIEPEKELAKGSRGTAVPYDLLNNKSHKGLVPNLDIIYDSFIRYYRVSISNRLRRLVEIKKMGARTYKFDEFLQTLPSPVCMAIYKMDPLKGASLIAMDSKLVFAIVDGILGGSGQPSVPEDSRMFTSIELRLVEKVVKDALLDMEKAWAPLQPTKISLLRMEMNPRLVNIVPSEYQIVTMALEVQIEEFSGTMVFAVPNMTIDPIRDKLKTGMQFDMMAGDPMWPQRLSAGLTEAMVEMTVELGEATITLEELLHLAPGDTIMLDRASQSELHVKLEGVPKYRAVPGSQHGNKAVQITGLVDRGV